MSQEFRKLSSILFVGAKITVKPVDKVKVPHEELTKLTFQALALHNANVKSLHMEIRPL